MFMWHQLFRWGTIIGLCLAGSTEVACTEKRLATIWQERYAQNVRRKGFKQVLEQDDGVLGFSKTNIRFEEREFDRKLANGHAELVFMKSAA